MLKSVIKKYGAFKLSFLLGDIISFILGIILSLSLSSKWEFILFHKNISIDKIVLFIITSFIGIILFRYSHLYKHNVIVNRSKHLYLVSRNILILFVLLIFLHFFISAMVNTNYFRTQIIIYILSSYFFIIVLRSIIYNRISIYRGTWNKDYRNILIIGAGKVGKEFVEKLKQNKNSGFNLLGFIDDDPGLLNKSINGISVCGTMNDLENIVKEKRIDEIFIAINSISYNNLVKLVQRCRSSKCQINIISDHFGIIGKKLKNQEFNDLQYVSVFQSINNLYVDLLKRIFDLVTAIIISVLLLPFLLLIGIFIKLSSKGPVFYAPTSIGKNGEPFMFIKFRSMYHGSPNTSHKKLVEDFMNGKIIGAKLRNDPRVTWIGKYLRKYSLDELPQLFNVIRGEMSLVGPRPSTQYEYDQMEEWHKYRYSILPGITGLWQIAGRAEVSFTDMIMMDLYYVENCSLWFDLIILYKTIRVVINGKGGY
jgi:exopolysaccharide biosynthesis polyprenyl glycosylphosphotransferase